MQSFRRLCPQCQRPLVSDEMYCGWCHAYAPQARSNQTGTFAPPPPSPDLSGPAWTQNGLVQDFSNTKIMPPEQMRPGNRKRRGPHLIGSLIGICFLVFASFWVGISFAQSEISHTGAPPPTRVATTVQATSTMATPTVQTTPTEVTPTFSAQSTPTTVAAALPTASLSSPQLPLSIACVDCPYPQLSAVLNSITMDSVGQSTNWTFTISNTGRRNCGRLRFYTLELIDPSGNEYGGKGQATGDFAIGTQQSLQINAVFALLPAAGTQYTLKMAIDVQGCDGDPYYNDVYATENFTFA